MATCKYDPGVNSSNPYAILTVTESSYSVEDNTSVVSWNLKLYRPYNISSSASKDYSVKINGSTVKSSTTTIGGSGTKTIASGTKTINHNSDGSKTISFSFSLEFGITWSGSSIGTGSASGSLKLTNIPRATTPTLTGLSSTLYFGDNLTISMDRASSSFDHTLTYSFGGASGTIGSDLGTSKTWTIPKSLIDKIPNATSGTLTITCKTYNGSTLIGRKTATATVKVPTSVTPTVSFTIEENVDEIKNVFGAYVKGLSKLDIKATGTGVYSSTIKTYKIMANGQTFSTASATTSALKSSGTLTITVEVTDSRGRTGSASKSITVSNYSPPAITTFTGVRCDADGTENDEGEYVLLTLVGSVSNISGNTATYKVGRKKSSESDYEYTTLSNTSLSIDRTYIYNDFDTDNTYDIIFVVTDAIGNEAKKAITMGTAFTLVDYHGGGKGMGIGKVAEYADILDIALTTLFRKAIQMGLYDDQEKNIYFQNNASRLGQTYEDNSIYPHDCKIYGGSGSSPMGIGLYDRANDRRILAYNDYQNFLFTDSVFRQHIIDVNPSSASTITAEDTWTTVTMGYGNLSAMSGNWLELSDGGVKCNRDGYVSVSGCLYLSGLTVDDITGIAIIRKREDTETNISYAYKKEANTNVYHSLSPRTISVSAGDIILLKMRNASGARGTNSTSGAITRLVVQYVG